uniref:ABC-2 type transporter n=1 Tax=Plocamium cartilagineum TaxID=31452 RepID=A0A1C9CHY5_PLOCA|nr:ABC-2 type transporter [Plocamium cartilagineum]AOM68003.1 ABC-2 type transporter [Plocamium cartilagineum]
MINTIKKEYSNKYLKIQPNNKITNTNKIKNLFYEVFSLTKRLSIQIKRRPSTLVAGIIQPLLWLILFGALFQNAPVGLLTSNIQYNKFLSPGIIVFTAFNGSINAGLPLMFDREFGFLNRLLIAPLISRNSLLISSVIFIATITMLQTLIIITCSLIMFQSITNINSLFKIMIITLLITLSVASISICLAFLLPGHIEFLAFILIINLPTLFSSTALAPLSFMPYWLQIIASINPLTYAIEGIRYICLNSNLIEIKTVWLHLNLNGVLLILLLLNIITFNLVKKIISYKYD